MELPSDLIEEILLRVPTKSLVRLRHTCKQWKTIVSDPRFFYKRLPREQQFTVFNEIYDPSGSEIFCVGIDSKEPCLQIEFVKKLDSGVIDIYHCDGLLLLVMKTKLLVWNPLLKEGRWIQRGGFGMEPRNCWETTYGLGYISNQSDCNDWKMVRFQCPYRYKKDEDGNVQVYEFKRDRWKHIVDKNFDGFEEGPLSNVCLRGTPYWLGYNKCDGDYANRTFSMASFDFSNERFEYVFKVLDESFGSIHIWKDYLSLGIFKGDHLALLHGAYKTNSINIWVMKVDKDWSKLMTIKLNSEESIYMKPTLSSYFIENNGRLILTVNYYKYEYLTYVVGENQRLHLLTDSPIYSYMSGCYYVPSLLQVPAFQGKKKKKKNKKNMKDKNMIGEVKGGSERKRRRRT